MEVREFAAGDFLGLLQVIQGGCKLVPSDEVVNEGFGGNCG
jgi:hypothetical protein